MTEKPELTFGSMEDVMKMAEKLKTKKTTAKTPTGSENPAVARIRELKSDGYLYCPTEFKVLTPPPVADVDVFQVIHFYTRADDSWNKVLIDAKREKEYRNTNVVVVAHSHSWDVPCVKRDKIPCREV